ncbi:hypothetical protein [Labrenzia sp. 011]|uniref:hypothetical protein n=1 Tax=Labrenzia sp. 011 TaxID=2171494 RepID=UPI0010575704|nr:hypothetical protein [Labrenzia sp. 011]
MAQMKRLRGFRDQVSRDGADEKILVGWFVVGVSDLRSFFPVFNDRAGTFERPPAFPSYEAKRLPRNPISGPALFALRDCSLFANKPFSRLNFTTRARRSAVSKENLSAVERLSKISATRNRPDRFEGIAPDTGPVPGARYGLID